MVNCCGVCEKGVTPNTPNLKCSAGCNKHIHNKCSGLNDTEISSIISSRRKWTCPKCTPDNIPLTLNSIRNLITEQFNSFAEELKRSIADEIKNFIAKRLDDIDLRISQLENKCTSLESELCEVKTNSKTSPENIINELEERRRRQTNVVLFNFEESKAALPVERAKEDMTNITKIFTLRKISVKPIKIIRLGNRAIGNKPRPLKIVLDSADAANSVLKSNTNAVNDNIIFNSDRTKLQIEYHNKLKTELTYRRSNGESNLKMAYRNGIPYLTQTRET